MRRLAFLLSALLGWLCTTAQKDFHFENFTARDGLSHNEVRSLLRDSRGFLWVGTANGLNRFDGYDFQVFLPEASRANYLAGEAIAFSATSLASFRSAKAWSA